MNTRIKNSVYNDGMITLYHNIWPEIPAVKQNPGLSWALIPTGSEASPEVEEDVLVSSQPLLCFSKYFNFLPNLIFRRGSSTFRGEQTTATLK